MYATIITQFKSSDRSQWRRDS